MNDNLKILFISEIKALFELKKTERLWHIPVLASLCVGIPLLIGYYFDRLDYGILSCIAGLVILYMPLTTVARRMITLLACSFGFMISFFIGVCFSFNPIVSSVVLGFFAISVHWVVNYFRMKPPGSFFFIMIASLASCMPFNLATIPIRVGLIGMGAMLACTLALFYSLYSTKKYPPKKELIVIEKNNDTTLFESVIVGFFIFLSLITGHLLELENPYWLPISCAAVMQGASFKHVWQRSFQRVLGTFVGLGLAWLLLLFKMTPLTICICIIVLQFIIEMLIVRHYGLAVIFITPLTLFLAEAGSAMVVDATTLISVRFMDIFLGSCIGAIAGWFLHDEELRHKAENQIRKAKTRISRK
ncbi:FUSC family protein [Flavobacterium sp. GT3P67]|uniref:FUSC family protein n=1 Tax=Flavobacterium sp. GT3P67 TaxID=2541722 RepID=UPI001044C391|nr:FUSC family protein [Flavobacterium sp. GT3P67]TDE53004.1 FUSC family protein [Flavobacterium sp. GT3P67]